MQKIRKNSRNRPQQANIQVAVVKTNNLNRLKENLGAFGWKIEEADIERLRKSFPEQMDISDIGPLALYSKHHGAC